MITAIISLGQVRGAGFWMIGWFLCAVAYFAVFLPKKANRGKSKNVLFWFLIGEVLTDLVWAVVGYNNCVYINYGIVAIYGLLLWPIVLGIAGIIATIQNKKANMK